MCQGEGPVDESSKQHCTQTYIHTHIHALARLYTLQQTGAHTQRGCNVLNFRDIHVYECARSYLQLRSKGLGDGMSIFRVRCCCVPFSDVRYISGPMNAIHTLLTNTIVQQQCTLSAET